MHGVAAERRDEGLSTSKDLLMDIGNMLKAFIGLNFIYVAYAFSKAGMFRGVIGLIVITLITEHCCMLLIQVKNAMPPTPVLQQGGYTRVSEGDEEDKPVEQTEVASGPAPTYGDIARFVGGRPAENVINAALVLTQFGYCVGYLIFISTTLHHMLPTVAQETVATKWVVLMPIPVLATIAMLSSIRSLGPFSLAANLALLFGFFAVVLFLAKHFHWQPSSPSISTLPLFFGQMTAALEGIGLVVPVETSMKNRAKFPIVLRTALGTLAAVLMIVGVMAYATYGEHTHSIILLNIGTSRTAGFVKAVLLLGILFTYPLQIIPVFQFLESFLDDRKENRVSEGDVTERTEHDAHIDTELLDNGTQTPLFMRDPRKIALRMCTVLLTAVVAIVAGRSFGLFQSLVGSLGASCLAYTAPSLFHYITYRDELSRFAKAKNIAIAMFGITGAIVGTVTSVLAFSSDEEVLRFSNLSEFNISWSRMMAKGTV